MSNASITTWKYRKDYETLRVINACRHITNGFFKINGFYPLPANRKYKEFNTVLLPEVLYNSIPRFWDRVEKTNDDFIPTLADRDLYEETYKLISKDLVGPKYQETEMAWQKAEKEVLSEISGVLNLKENQIKTIQVYPTRFSTGSSFEIDQSPQQTFRIFLREDMDIYQLAFALVSVLTRPFVFKNLSGSWEESQIIADWVIRQSSVGNVLKKYQKSTNFAGTINAIRSKENGNIAKISQEFCSKYGIPFKESNFTSNNGDVFVNDQKLELPNMSRKILAKLVENKGNIVTPDDLSTILAVEEDSFSLYAVSKAVQRVRDELEKNRLSSTYIQTLRGRGYMLR